MELHNLVKMSYKRNKKRICRGNAGKGGTTGGRGQKGYNSRSGSSIRPGFRGGQTPVYQQIPKLRGKKSLTFKKPVFTILNIKDLLKINNDVIDKKVLADNNLIKKENEPVKILSAGEYTGPAKELIVDAVSESAKVKLEKAGVKISILN